jgi:DNA-binding CsgD family transcriptional regulator
VQSQLELAASAAKTLRAGIAVLDRDGTISWVNEAWGRLTAAIPLLSGSTVGTNLSISRTTSDPIGQTFAVAVGAVSGGQLAHFELECPTRSGGPVRVSVTARPEHGGAVLLCAEERANMTAPAMVIRVDPAVLAERLTPRERDVLVGLADGLDNRTIASKLGVEYTTVRGYVRSLMEKLGARSRVDAVGIAYRTGLVHRGEMAS